MAPSSFCLQGEKKKKKHTKIPSFSVEGFSFFKKNIIKHQETEQSACRYYTCIINKISLFIYKETREELEN